MDIGSIIRKARKARGLTLEALAHQVDSDTGNLSRIERGKQGASQELLAKILSILDLSLTGLAEEPAGNVAPAEQPGRLYRYPVVSWVAAGAWREAIEPAGFDTFELSDYKGKGRSFWLEVKGDSMTAPAGESIPEGMLILVDTGLEPKPGDLVVAKLADSNEATFKQFVSDAGQKYLKPLNPAYRMLSIDDNCEMVGVVTRAIRKFR
ncbi:TPA: helix-turn-helix domain-containing protein [Pseudomonas aeruginosa]|uniref:helix-turn-helix domain-containing protein n=2 Tax=Pseudomonas aeruginosa TaxID=287 RepID=UPI0003D39932|nr:XRE family transcriptional regulator [Pseudomonas aeruginosa]ETD45788.1 sulfurtransferase [Pseudomonas aeruginosa VRFPA07]KSH37045.1 peptidase S24 [Pseudomonas aeruginosa]HBN7927583.1 helix-turn-helix domain-containing protein [Pseudomonas aeruginosa]HBN9138901.1 helix-turn-helix domain-containing protein [Pseudomonas aeruginosa]HCF1403327.1 helix-turn-helix domain-containing protein [Pseudomonas aeruginosa]